MGAIQNEVNQLLGTAAVVAGGYKKLKLDKLHATQEAIEKDPELKEEASKITKGIEEEEKAINDLARGREPGYAMSNRPQSELNKDIEARKLSIATMQGRLKAIDIQRKEYAKLLGGKK